MERIERYTTELREVPELVQAMERLGFKVQLRTDGWWEDKRGETSFYSSRGDEITKLGTVWATVLTFDGQYVMMKPDHGAVATETRNIGGVVVIGTID